jgi:hypothetical protein
MQAELLGRSALRYLSKAIETGWTLMNWGLYSIQPYILRPYRIVGEAVEDNKWGFGRPCASTREAPCLRP